MLTAAPSSRSDSIGSARSRPPRHVRHTAQEPGQYAADLFTKEHTQDVLELGAGHGRDTLAFLGAGFNVTALDYESDALLAVRERAELLGLADRLHITSHDVRDPLPYPDQSFDAVFSHMLFNMALTTTELEALANEVRRVTRPDGLHVYTVRHVGDAHYGTGVPLGDATYANGGFVVHFFDRTLVERLAAGFSILELHDFEEGALPRKLWRVRLRKN